ncbi:hypothetical protein CD127_09910 [Staphylococcus petrasii]|uniref:Ig-like domain-containing protein n=1 Tax=Staphylococcus petrasii TaxID=1276936 RepID=UPI000CD0610A|nr:Ig-like domain-containing protein [Staphylococcus petrasii]PNZ80596.1 hypothetical protein CD127_09910 [Staphylococcus petrasii]TGA81270.1 hypothetical protein E2554_07045 [Staphylococcus petrasii]SUM58728.1 putative biofilm-associated protein [Staphylococcus petrasii]
MKENVKKVVIKSLLLSQSFLAIGIISHSLNANHSIAFAEEKKVNDQVNQLKKQTVSTTQTQLNNKTTNASVTINQKVENDNKSINQSKMDNTNVSQQKQNYSQQTQSQNNADSKPTAKLSINNSQNTSIAKVNTQSSVVEKNSLNSSLDQQGKSNLTNSSNVQNIKTLSVQNQKVVEKKIPSQTQKNNLAKVKSEPTTVKSINQPTNTISAMSSQPQLKINKRYSYSSNPDVEKENDIKRVKASNDERMRNTEGNSSYINDNNPTYEGILSIETDKINYKPGETVKIYTEHNKNFVKPIYNEAKIYSHRLGGWDISNPPYYFDNTALVGRTTDFYRKPNGNWESLIEIKLPKKMVDDAFDIDIHSWNDNRIVNSWGSSNLLTIKVLNDSSVDKLGGYDSSAFDNSTIQKLEYDLPKIVKFSTDKKVYNPNDTVTITTEIEDESDLMYVSADLSTVEPNNYKMGSHTYIPMNFANFTRDLVLLDNGNWQATLQFKLPSYIKTGTIKINSIIAADKYGNERVYDPSYNGQTKNSMVQVERTENVQSFTVDPVADFSREIRGKATSGMMIYAYSNGKKIGQAQVVDGKYFMSIPKQAAYSKIQVYTVNKYKNKSKEVTTTVLDKTAPIKPTISKLAPRTITGKGEIGSTIYVYKGSTKLGTATVTSKGTYSINIRPQRKGTTLTLYAKDKANNKSSLTTIKVK